MAKFITRTVEYTEATVLCLNTETCEPCNITKVFNGTFEEAKLERKVMKAEYPDFVKPVQVVAVNVRSELRRMTEDFFIANSEVVTKNEDNQ